MSPTPMAPARMNPLHTLGAGAVPTLPTASWVLQRGRLASWHELWTSVITFLEKL